VLLLLAKLNADHTVSLTARNAVESLGQKARVLFVELLQKQETVVGVSILFLVITREKRNLLSTSH
jgi:hypothetical protein